MLVPRPGGPVALVRLRGQRVLEQGQVPEREQALGLEPALGLELALARQALQVWQ